MPRLPVFKLFFACTLISLLSAAQAAQAALPAPVGKLLSEANIAEESMAAMVIRVSDGKVMLAHRARQAMQPASTMKMLTTYIGLETLGPVFRGRTELRTNGTLLGETLEGDLILRGGADADLSWEALQKMLQSLRYQGIRRIHGELVVDRQLFLPARPELGAAPFDEAPEFPYNVIPDALLLNQNLLQLDLQGGEQEPVQVRSTPELEGVTVVSDMTLSDAECGNWGSGWLPPSVSRTEGGELRVTLHGSYPRNCEASASINVLERQEYARRLVHALWIKLGGTWDGGSREEATPAGTRLLAEHQARPLGELVRDINKQSDNTLARLLYLSLGSFAPAEAPDGDRAASFGEAAAGDATGTPANDKLPTGSRSEQVVRAWFRQHDISDAGLVLENGSGLSRTERISAAQMAALLQVASASNWAPEFLASLPIAGLDGTMKRRLKTSPAAARARIKTGTLKNVVAIAGFVPDSRNRAYIVVAMINSDSGSLATARAATDALIDWVARKR